MADLPEFAALDRVDRRILKGVLDELGTPAWTATYEHVWERGRATWTAVDTALARAARPRLLRRPPERDTVPRWLDTLVRQTLEDMSSGHWQHGRFGHVRLLERLGLTGPAHDATYVLAFVSNFPEPRAERLRADPELLDTVLWQVFEHEGGGEVSLANIDRFFGKVTWRETFVELVADGSLDRDRVQRSCLDALRRDFNHYRAAWFTATYLALEPTATELAGHQDQLRALLRSDLPATVGFALKLLQALVRPGLLDAAATLGDLTAAAVVRPKGTAAGAVKLAAALAATDASLAPLALPVARAGLEHDHADVQSASARLLQEYGEHAALASGAEALAPSVQQGLGLAVTGSAGPEAHSQPLRAPAPPVTPDDLVERTAALLEDAGDPSEVEAVLAALAATGNAGALQPLAKRARAVLARDVVTPYDVGGLRAWLAALVLAERHGPPPVRTPPGGQIRFLLARLVEVGEALAGTRAPAPLLAEPDLAGGWIAPTTLVARARDLTSRGLSPAHHDTVAALLRLHPEGRADALADAADLPGPLGAVLRHALGGAAATDGVPSAWRVAAARTRTPYDDDPELLAAGLGAAGQGRAPRPSLVPTLHEHTWNDGRVHVSRYYRWRLEVPDGVLPDDEAPTMLAARSADVVSPDRQLGDWLGLLAGIWPHDAEHVAALTFSSVMAAAAYPTVLHDVPRILDALAHHPGRHGACSRQLLAVGLAAGRADQRLAAIDAFVDLVGSGRIGAVELADTMAPLHEGLTVTRWADGLRSAAAVPAAGLAAIDVLTRVLPQLTPDLRGLHALLDVLHQESLRRGRVVTDAQLRGWLAGLTGSSRAARTARALLG